MSSSVPTVVVTGAGGFVGTELVKQLLMEGYTVRATVRKIGSSQYAHLEKLASVLPGKLDYFEADLTEPGSFDKPIEGATYVFHTASPIDMGTDDNERDEREVLEPAVGGTSTVIKAAAKQKSVKRIVITSSIAAIMTSKDMYPKEGEVYDDKTFNTHDTVETSAYQASKSAAEREAWQLAEDLKVDIVTIHPSLVVGPLSSTRRGLSADIGRKVLTGFKFQDFPDTRCIDVRDVAEAHILAAVLPEAKGRYILSQAETTNWKKLSEDVQAAFPDQKFAPGEYTKVSKSFDISKVENELGMRLRPINKAFIDAVRTTLSLGLVKDGKVV